MKVDVLIAGYGPVALVTASILSKSGIKVGLIQSNPNPVAQASSKLLALSLSSIKLFQEHELVKNIKDIGQPIKQIQIAQYKQTSVLRFHPQSINCSHFGYMVDERDLWQSLFQSISKPHVNILHISGQVANIDNKDSLICVEVCDNQIFQAELLIIAEGKNSPSRKKLHFEVLTKDYHQVALVCDIKHSKHHQGIARELFMPQGPFAMLPKIGGFTSSIVWTESSGTQSFLSSLKQELLISLIQERCGNSLGTIEAVSQPSLWPLSLVQSQSSIDQRVLLMGDSLHSIHPLAGQGLNLGLRDVQEAVNLIIKAKKIGGDLGDENLLSRYQANRKADIQSLITTVDIINKLYKGNSFFLNFVGSKAIEIFRFCQPLKQIFIHYAAGNHY